MLKRFFISMLGTMAGLWVSILIQIVIGILLIGIVVGKSSNTTTVTIQSKSALLLDLSGTIKDRNTPTPFIQYIQQAESTTPTLEDMTLALQSAADDKDIKGVYIRCGGASMGTAAREELIEAINKFKESGKWVYAYADNYTQGDYMVATTADKVILNPIGSIDIHGIGGITPFFKNLLDKIGVKTQIIKVGTYKSAVEPYILTSMSEPARQQMQQYVDSLWAYISEEIAHNRSVALDSIKTMASQFTSTHLAQTFIDNGLVDELMYKRQVEDELLDLCGLDSDDDLRLITPLEYVESRSISSYNTNKQHIAVLYAIGEISDSGTEGIVGSTMVNEITKLADDDDVAGMVFRVNSPGGSAFASEQIWEALEYFKSKNKPLYVSMGDYAASGGYYISCGADRIFADRATLTGSIGVFGMIPDFSGLVTDKLGVNFSSVESNPNAIGLSTVQPMSPEQHQAMQKSVENIYDLFTKRVATGRNIDQDYVKTIAEGRVWIAGDAIKLGLVDTLGSLDDAINAMAEKLDISNTNIARYPIYEEHLVDKIMRNYGNIEQLRQAGYDAETLILIETVRRLRTDSPIQARTELVIFR